MIGRTWFKGIINRVLLPFRYFVRFSAESRAEEWKLLVLFRKKGILGQA